MMAVIIIVVLNLCLKSGTTFSQSLMSLMVFPLEKLVVTGSSNVWLLVFATLCLSSLLS